MKSTARSVLLFAVAGGLVAVAAVVVLGRGGAKSGGTTVPNVSSVGGSQVIEISAKGGYSPRETAAEADMPTALKIKTSGTFDCSSALTIPKLGYETNLPPSGETVVNVPPQKAGTVLTGLCSMGMYSFTIRFN